MLLFQITELLWHFDGFLWPIYSISVFLDGFQTFRFVVEKKWPNFWSMWTPSKSTWNHPTNLTVYVLYKLIRYDTIFHKHILYTHIIEYVYMYICIQVYRYRYRYRYIVSKYPTIPRVTLKTTGPSNCSTALALAVIKASGFGRLTAQTTWDLRQRLGDFSSGLQRSKMVIYKKWWFIKNGDL